MDCAKPYFAHNIIVSKIKDLILSVPCGTDWRSIFRILYIHPKYLTMGFNRLIITCNGLQ